MNKFNSTIKQKTCKNPFCGKYPKMGYQGYCGVKCMPEHLQGLERFKKSNVTNRNRASLANLSKKVSEYQKSTFIENNALKSLDEKLTLDNWFFERRKEMEGVCINCGKSTNKKDDKYYRWSVCHIVPKSLVSSVATNVNNWVELCQQCHQEYDNTFDKAAAMPCFEEIKAKFQLFKKLIPPQEYRKINPHLTN